MMTRRSKLKAVWNRKQWVVPYLNPWSEQRTSPNHDGPKHLMFLFVDHFEPGHGGANPDLQMERIERWHRVYPEVVGSFRDCEGVNPKHTWFYLGQEPGHLMKLGELCFHRFGEVELHIHHGPKDTIPDHWKQNSREDLARFIESQKQLFAKFGALITAEPSPQNVFAFLHGMFALDNSLPDYCGVSGELELLKDLGCYGDFTFPAPGKSQPPLVNRLYYPTGNPEEGGSYFHGEEIKVGAERRKAVLIFQGPLGLRRKGFKIQVEDGHLDWRLPPTRERIRYWISKGIHVSGQPEWIFVKVYTHGCMEKNVRNFLGRTMERLHQGLMDTVENDLNISLHYVSAREAFNIAMAAMAGKEGDPGRYRDFLIPPYANTVIQCIRPYQLMGYSGRGWNLFFPDPGEVDLKIKGDWTAEIKSAYLKEIRLFPDDVQGRMVLQASGEGRIEGTFQTLQGMGPSCGKTGQEGEVQFNPGEDEAVLSFSGSFSPKGLLNFWWDLRG